MITRYDNAICKMGAAFTHNDHACTRVITLKECFALFYHKPDEILRSVILVDEIWTHRISSYNRNNEANKVVMIGFWNAGGIIHTHYVQEEEQSIAINMSTYWTCSNEVLRTKYPHLSMKKVHLHQDKKTGFNLACKENLVLRSLFILNVSFTDTSSAPYICSGLITWL